MRWFDGVKNSAHALFSNVNLLVQKGSYDLTQATMNQHELAEIDDNRLFSCLKDKIQAFTWVQNGEQLKFM